MIRLKPFTATFLDLSWDWLRDPEIKALTMTPDFDRKSQQRFFECIPDRPDYRIWGVALLDGRPIGVAGLKRIDGKVAEYWGYIGEKDCWGQGLGSQMLASVEDKANMMGINQLYLTVAQENQRAVSLYRKAGYIADDRNSNTLIMVKIIGELPDTK